MSEISSSSIRFVGMASGLDVDTIVSSLISAEQSKIDSIKQKKVLLDWKSNELKNVNSLISSFMDKYFSGASPDTNINMSSSFSTKKVVISNSQYIGVEASGNAAEGSYSINSISSLASSSTAQSVTGISADAESKISLNIQLKDLDLKTPMMFAQGMDADGNVQNTVSFSINGVDFSFKDTDTLTKVISTVNGSSAGVTMSYSSLSDKISIKSKTLGTDSQILITNTEGNFFADSAVDSAVGIAIGTVKNGTNAILSINGYTVEQSSNSFTIDDVTYNLLGTASEEINFTVSQNIDSIYSRIKGFVTGYNELISSLNSKVSEERYRTYLPLTDSQKDQMSEKEIEQWEEKAKSGLIKNDYKISNLLTKIRNAFVQTVEDAGISFSEIGIKTGYWSEKGKLHIDEAKLKNALSNNAEAVKKLFLNTSAAEDGAEKFSRSGLVQRVNDCMKDYLSNVKSGVLAQTTKQISDYSDKITRAIEKLNEKETYYYKQYAALESALSKLNSQSSYFSSMLNS